MGTPSRPRAGNCCVIAYYEMEAEEASRKTLRKRLRERAEVGPSDDLEPLLALLNASTAKAQAAWPSVSCPIGGFLCHLAEKADPGEPLSTALAKLHVSDLFLAYSAGLGIASAVHAFDAFAMKDIHSALRRMVDANAVSEIKQAIRVHLLLQDNRDRPRVHDYSGTGPLAGWVRVTAVRLALASKKQGRELAVGDQALQDAQDTVDPLLEKTTDPELEMLRSRYAGELKAALHRALFALADEQRTVLRMHYNEGLSLDELAKVFAVHRATVARWLQSARIALRDHMKEMLRAHLSLREDEAESLLGLVDSRFNASMVRVLGESA
jgi:RNA polymerase sigma-70 factor, ECF subfamily